MKHDIIYALFFIFWGIATVLGIGCLLFGYIEKAILNFVLANGFNIMLIKYEDYDT